MSTDGLTRRDDVVLFLGLVTTALVAFGVDPYIAVEWTGPTVGWPLPRTEPLLEAVLQATVGTSIGIIPLLVWRWVRPPNTD